MVKIVTDLPHVERFRDRHGRMRFYYRNRRGSGVRYPLRGPEGSSIFVLDYRQAAAADDALASTKKVDPRSTTSWLIQKYYSSAAFKQLGESTQRVRKGRLNRFIATHGDKRFRQLKPKHLREVRDQHTDTPDQMNNILKDLRQVFKYAIEQDLVDSNPAAAVTYLKSNNPDGFHTWSLEEVEQYETTHPVGTKARLALALLLYTGQRRSDIVLLGRQHERNEWLVFTQFKGRNRKPKHMELPIISELRRIIDASPTGDLNYIVTEFGKPFTSNGFGNRLRKWCDAAGLPQCSAHGLRKAAGARMAELGCTAHQIAAILGHDTLKEVERYTKAARQKHLAGEAAARMENSVSQTADQNCPKPQNKEL